MVSKKKIVTLASINSHDQIVISGDKSAVCEASLYCRKFGAKHILNLNTNIAAHCKLMKPISRNLKNILKNITINSPKIPIISNVHVKFEKTNYNIKKALIKQIYSTVRWKETIELIQLKKIFVMLEIGPNKILTNLNKHNKNITSLSTNNLKNFLTAFRILNK